MKLHLLLFLILFLLFFVWVYYPFEETICNFQDGIFEVEITKRHTWDVGGNYFISISEAGEELVGRNLVGVPIEYDSSMFISKIDDLTFVVERNCEESETGRCFVECFVVSKYR